MISLIENPMMMLSKNMNESGKELLDDEYCKFNIQLSNNSSITLMMHNKDTLSDLHQKLNNRLRINNTNINSNLEFDDIPLPEIYNQPIEIHDIFVCSEKLPEILSIMNDKKMVISDFIDKHKIYFQDKNVYTIYVIDKEYYKNWLDRQKINKSIFTYITHNLISFMNSK